MFNQSTDIETVDLAVGGIAFEILIAAFEMIGRVASDDVVKAFGLPQMVRGEAPNLFIFVRRELAGLARKMAKQSCQDGAQQETARPGDNSGVSRPQLAH